MCTVAVVPVGIASSQGRPDLACGLVIVVAYEVPVIKIGIHQEMFGD
jgi:hypothetical protein